MLESIKVKYFFKYWLGIAEVIEVKVEKSESAVAGWIQTTLFFEPDAGNSGNANRQ